jgi:hypothetical protein
MSHFVFCSECGTKLNIYRRALPKYNTIIELVPSHICSEEPVEIDLTINPIPLESIKPVGKFASKLHKLQPPPKSLPDGIAIPTEPGDRRPKDVVKSIAPQGILDAIKKDNEPPQSDLE